MVLLFTAAGVPAMAQTATGAAAPYPQCGDKRPKADDVAVAKKTYALGNRYLSEADYDRAISYFRDAYRTDCTAHKLLGYIARAYELKGDRAEAIRALEVYLERSPGADDADVVEKRIANLRAQLASQTPQAPAPSASAPVEPAPPASAAPPAAPPGAPMPSAVPPPPPPAASPWPWVLTGVGAAAAVAGGVQIGVGATAVSDAASQCKDPAHHAQCTPDAVTKGNNGRTVQTVGAALLAGGIGAVSAGLLWHFYFDAHPAPSEGKAAARVSPVVAPSFLGASVDGTF